MYISSSLASLALFSVTSAGASSLNLAQTPISGLLDLSAESICPLADVFTHSKPHHHSDVCTHTHSHPHHLHLSHNSSTSAKPTQSQPESWTNHPICSENTTTEFCVFTSSTFFGGRGISILTKPSIARLISRLKAFSLPATSSLSPNDPRDQPFTVEDIPGRGKGMIANRTIERGDLIKAHPAIAIFHNDAVDKSSPVYASYAPLMKLAVDQLPSQSRDLFLAMAAHNETEEPYIERIYTNTFGEEFGGGRDGEEHSIVVPETARLNHDCRPNAMYYFDKGTLMHYTHAARRIYAGEEITITYIDPLQTRLKRRAALQRSWGFECSCSLCSQGDMFVKESNRRVVLINKLIKVFVKTNRRSRKVGGTPQMAELLVGLYEQERLYASAGDAYRIAALSYSSVGNRWEALRYGVKALEWGLIHDGPHEGEVRDMQRLVEAAERHWSWGVNVRKVEEGRRERNREEV